MAVPPPLFCGVQTDQPLEGLPRGRGEAERDGETLPPRLLLKLLNVLRCHSERERETQSDQDKLEGSETPMISLESRDQLPAPSDAVTQLLCLNSERETPSHKICIIYNSSMCMRECHSKLPKPKKNLQKNSKKYNNFFFQNPEIQIVP